MFGELNVLYAKVAKGKNFGHICPCSVKHLVKVVDSEFIPCSACKGLMVIQSYWFNFDVYSFEQVIHKH